MSVWSLVGLGVIAVTMSGCKPTQQQPGPREKITIAYSTASNAILVYIAFAKGYFAEEGLDAVPQPHAFGKLALNAVIEGKADLATVADTPIVFAVMNGKKITTLAVIQTSNRDNAIVARKDRGIAKPADLKGKKIGVPLGTSADFFLYSILLAHDVKRGQVTLVDMKPDKMAAALDQGKVDAVSTFNPTIKQLERQLGKHGIVFFGESLYTETFCIAAMQEYARKNPEAVKKILRALLKAETFVQRHDREARVLVAEFIKLNKADLDEIWHIFTFRVTLDQALLVNFEDQTRWVLKNRLAPRKTMPNYLDCIYADGLYSVKPEAVRIVR
jgi:ABC-type nitrate/sulfonate/bicarbonate transport system substrate-binding protein